MQRNNAIAKIKIRIHTSQSNWHTPLNRNLHIIHIPYKGGISSHIYYGDNNHHLWGLNYH